MGTHIIWRNPSLPRKREIQISRVMRNHTAAVYQAATAGGLKRLFQLFRKNAAAAVVACGDLVLSP